MRFDEKLLDGRLSAFEVAFTFADVVATTGVPSTFWRAFFGVIRYRKPEKAANITAGIIRTTYLLSGPRDIASPTKPIHVLFPIPTKIAKIAASAVPSIAYCAGFTPATFSWMWGSQRMR